MAELTLKDIQISARQEAYRMRHFYLGVEHFIIAMLETPGSLANSVLEDYGLAPQFVIDAIRRKIGKGSKQRLWAGMPYTPRAEVILSIADDLSMEAGREEVTERDLLVSILEERDSIPVRVLQALGVELGEFVQAARTFHPTRSRIAQPNIKVTFGLDFDSGDAITREQQYILRRMFYGYDQIRIEQRLAGGYTKAMLFVVTPIQADGREDAAVVAKIDTPANILGESQRYNTFVKNTLPPLTARIEERPTTPEGSMLAGIKYTLVASGEKTARDLRSAARDLPAARLAAWLRDQFYPTFSPYWWEQRQPYRFQVWQEYDWLLPPILTLELEADQDAWENAQVLRAPLTPGQISNLQYGDLVAVENFSVHHLDPRHNRLLLANGHGIEAVKRAHKIGVRGVNFAQSTHFPGEVIERLVGRIWETRDQSLTHAARALEPDFDLRGNMIAIGTSSLTQLPNPLLNYQPLLERQINGSLSRLHGDLHLGNILIGPNESPSLIDFAHARDGHTLFDWAMLEITLLDSLVMPAAGDSWDDARSIVAHLVLLNSLPMAANDTPIAEALAPIKVGREIVADFLVDRSNWSEYYAALACVALRAISWKTMSIPSRRLMFLLAALAISQVKDKSPSASKPGQTPSSDKTDRADSASRLEFPES